LSIRVPEGMENSIKVVAEDFMTFKSDLSFDLIYSSVVQTLPKSFKLKLFILAYQSFRHGSPLILIGKKTLFQLKDEDEDDETSIFEKKGNTERVIRYSPRISYLITQGVSFWGTTTSGAGLKMAKNFKTEVIHQRDRAWSPYQDCSPVFSLLRGRSAVFNNSRGAISPNNCPKRVLFTFLNRTYHLEMSAAFGLKIAGIKSSTDYCHEYLQAVYFKVR
jgi:hypothetical protein